MSEKIALIIGGKIHNLQLNISKNIQVFEDVKIVDAIVLAQQLEQQGCQAIITTLGTAAALKGMINIPIVKATHTLFDILTSILALKKNHGTQNSKLFIIIHNSKLIDSESLQQFFNNEVTLLYYNELIDIKSMVDSIPLDDNHIVIGGPSTLAYAKKRNLKAWHLYFGHETLTIAIDKARSLLQEAKEALAFSIKMRTILNLLDNGLIITDGGGYIVDCNNRAYTQFEMERRDILGKKIQDIVGTADWITSYLNGAPTKNQVKKYKHKTFFVSDYPIILTDNTIIGALATIQEVSEIDKLEKKYRQIQTAGLIAKNTFDDILGNSESIQYAVSQARTYAGVESTILICGETGTGKELFAQSIHNASSRKFGPFIAINCAALPENLLESELFGYEEGAFTGARKGGKTGLVELAHMGTLFLDEVNHIPASVQARMLRVVQEKQVMRLGGEKIIHVNVRIMSATNEDLLACVNNNKFREDLYYRLNVLEIKIPSLRERISDIQVLANFLTDQFISQYGYCDYLSSDSIDKLNRYAWPGNIRELRNFIERYVVLITSRISTQEIFVSEYLKNHLSKRTELINVPEKTITDTVTLKIDTLEKMQINIVKQVLIYEHGNKSQTALMLGISRTSLWKKLNTT